MSWFMLALICVCGWGLADLFYKKGTDEDDRFSHLKIAVWVGIVMGVCAIALLVLSMTGTLSLAETDFTLGSLGEGIIKYSPVALCYIISMVIGYAGLRYLELSIVSPVQNASGALSMVCMIVFFTARGKFGTITDEFSMLEFIGTALIIFGMIILGFVEQHLSKGEIGEHDKKYRFGALALLFPILYCVFDTIGTAADGIVLDEETGLGFGEIDVIILYGLTFLLVGIGAYIYMFIRTKKAYNPFAKSERPKMCAAIAEEFGQVFYVYAMASNPVIAAPMVASYCIVSVILGHIFLKEKLTGGQYASILLVIVGIFLLGVAEGLAA